MPAWLLPVAMITVVPALGPLRETALAFLYRDLPPAEQCAQLASMLHSEDRREFLLEELLLARSDGEPAGALLAIRQPGRSAFLWPPVVAAKYSNEVADALLQAAGRRFDEEQVLFAQCLLEVADEANRATLSRNGFEHAADLLFLRRSLTDHVPVAPTPDLETVTIDVGFRNRLIELVQRTYVGTLDCRLLDGVRDAVEMVATYEAASAFNPQQSRIYRSGNADVGVLLLGDHPDGNDWEVLYFGVVPEARGRGLGRALLRDALDAAQRAGRRAVWLAVDSTNHYAVDIYYNLGFLLRGIQAVHLRIGRKQ